MSHDYVSAKKTLSAASHNAPRISQFVTNKVRNKLKSHDFPIFDVSHNELVIYCMDIVRDMSIVKEFDMPMEKL